MTKIPKMLIFYACGLFRKFCRFWKLYEAFWDRNLEKCPEGCFFGNCNFFGPFGVLFVAFRDLKIEMSEKRGPRMLLYVDEMDQNSKKWSILKPAPQAPFLSRRLKTRWFAEVAKPRGKPPRIYIYIYMEWVYFLLSLFIVVVDKVVFYLFRWMR